MENTDFRECFLDGLEKPVVAIVDDDLFVFEDPEEGFLPDITGVDVENHFENVINVNEVKTFLFFDKVNVNLVVIFDAQVVKTQTKHNRLL